MKKFSFSLQKVLDLREFEKKQAEVELGKAVAEETKIQQTLEMVAQQRASSVKAADQLTDLQELYNINNYFILLDKRKEELLQELTKAHIVTQTKREIMRDAMQKCKVLENLRDNRFSAWKKEMQKAEENDIDDVVTSRFNGGE